jgi:hypothetical protein
MKTREEIIMSGRKNELLILEVLLDIRDLLNKENKYKCDVCGREFEERIALAGHKRSHKGDNK